MVETARKSWTLQALKEKGLDPERYEILNGELAAVKEVSVEGSRIWSRLSHLLYAPAVEGGLGEIYSAGRFLMRKNPRRERRPDLAFVRAERVLSEKVEIFPAAPDLVIEILSPSDTTSTASDKGREDLKDGVIEEWIVDPDLEIVTVLRSGVPARPYGIGDAIESPVLPGVVLRLEDLFRVSGRMD